MKWIRFGNSFVGWELESDVLFVVSLYNGRWRGYVMSQSEDTEPHEVTPEAGYPAPKMAQTALEEFRSAM